MNSNEESIPTQSIKKQCPINNYESLLSPPPPSSSTSLSTSSSSSSSFTNTTTTDINILQHPFYHPTDDLPWVYHNVLASAPMVRISNLPFRLTCKTYGANMLYSEELVGLKLQHCTKITSLYDFALSPIQSDSNYNNNIQDDNIQQNQTTSLLSHFVVQKNLEHLQLQYHTLLTKNSTQGTFISPSTTKYSDHTNNEQLFLHQFEIAQQNQFYRQLNLFNFNSELTTYPSERLVIQLGVGTSIDALKSAEVIYNDCRAIDINLGCPKLFSTQALFGSELLIRPEIVEDIIKTLKRNFPTKPITVKIRMLPDIKHTIELIRRVEACGVNAIAIHTRYKADRPRYQSLPLQQLPLLCSIARVPLLYNGDIYSYHEIEQYKHITRGCWCPGADINRSFCMCGSQNINANGVHGVLIGRGAMYNPSVFGHYLVDPITTTQYNDNNNIDQQSLIQPLSNNTNLNNDITNTTPSHTIDINTISNNTNNNDNSNHNNNNDGQIHPPIWDPLQKLTSISSPFNYFCNNDLFQTYRAQFTQPTIYSQRQPYPINYQNELQRRIDSNGLLEPYEYTPTRDNINPIQQHQLQLQQSQFNNEKRLNTNTANTNNNIDISTIELSTTTTTPTPTTTTTQPLASTKSKATQYHLFSNATWPIQNGKPFIPPNPKEYNDLLEEIDASIQLRNHQAIESQQQQQNQQNEQEQQQESINTTESTIQTSTCYDQDETIIESTESIETTTATESTQATTTPTPTTTTSDATTTTTNTPTPTTTTTTTTTTTKSNTTLDTNRLSTEDYSIYKIRTKPYQYNDPSLNPWQSWSFGLSYMNSFLNTTNQSQLYMMPVMYPVILFTLLSTSLSSPLAQTKYITQAMLKFHNLITKDSGFRMINTSRLLKDCADGLIQLKSLHCFTNVFYHPNIITKHEIRPPPKVKNGNNNNNTNTNNNKT